MTERYRITEYGENASRQRVATGLQAEGHLAAVPPHLQRLFDAGLSIRLPDGTFIKKIIPGEEGRLYG